MKNEAVTAFPDKLPLNKVLAVTKLPVTAVPVTLPEKIPVIRTSVAALYYNPASTDAAIPDVVLDVFESTGK